MKHDPCYDQVANPNAGAVRPPGKPDSTTDALGKTHPQNQSSFTAMEIKGAARVQMNKQIGETAIPVVHDRAKGDPKPVDLN